MSWTAPAFLDEFGQRLEERSGLSGVRVYTAPVDQLDAEENIVFVRVVGDQSWSAIGNQSRHDVYTIESAILITRVGSGDDVAKQARDRATELLVEVVDDVQALLSSSSAQTFATAIGATQIHGLNVARINLNQGADQDQRWAQVDFDIEVKALIS